MNAEIGRADKILVKLGLYESRAAAQAAIAAGCVTAAGKPITKASQILSTNAKIDARRPHPYVSRAGLKLAHALKIFDIQPKDRLCLDIGASTGGFSQVLLEAGAHRVIAVDVGHGQLHPSLAGTPRLISLERTDARSLSAHQLLSPPDLIVCDASFISLHKVLAVPLSLAAPTADLICLFKPQFEVGRAYIGKGGLVRNQDAVQRAQTAFCSWLEQHDWSVMAHSDSPITGGDGNAETLIWAQRGSQRHAPIAL